MFKDKDKDLWSEDKNKDKNMVLKSKNKDLWSEDKDKDKDNDLKSTDKDKDKDLLVFEDKGIPEQHC